ncbi:MAG: hypothetical protein ACOH1Y_16060 [Propionicimonas sp.]
MERLQDRLRRWSDRKTIRAQRQLVVTALAVLSVTAALGSLLGRNPISITVGSFCGLGMALLLRHGFNLLPAPSQERWNVKCRYPFALRRWMVTFMAAIVITVLIAVGKSLPYALGGAITVCAFILLALLFLPTTEELARMDLAARESAETAERLAATDDWDGNTSHGLSGPPDPEPNHTQ